MFATRQTRAEARASRAEADRVAAEAAERLQQLRDDQERRQAEARRQQMLQAQQARTNMLNAMSPEDRAAFLDNDERVRQEKFYHIPAAPDPPRPARLIKQNPLR